LIRKFIGCFGIGRIEALTADREFIGEKWLSFLADHSIPFVIRLKEVGQYIGNSRGQYVKVGNLARHLKPAQSIYLGIRKIGKGRNAVRCHITLAKHHTGEVIAVIHSSTITEPLAVYAKRWQIETMFRAFKTGGFDSETTHVTHYKRLDTLMQCVAIAFCLAHQMGLLQDATSPPKIKKNGVRRKSIFRVGLDAIATFLAFPSKRQHLWLQLLQKINELLRGIKNVMY
jgi:hypothetical protein